MPTWESEPDDTTPGLLQVSGLSAGYGKLRVLHDIDMYVDAGEIVALVGPNGAGKTTLLSAMSGLVRDITGGTTTFKGRDITGWRPRATVKAGLLHVVEGHRVFANLSVDENIALGGFGMSKADRGVAVDQAFEVFPELAERRGEKAGRLSGGQQQMLVIAQGLVRKPRLLMLDEPSAGLSPILVDRILKVAQELRADGIGVVIVEQQVEKVLAVSDRAYVVTQGRMTFSGPAQELASGDAVKQAYLG